VRPWGGVSITARATSITYKYDGQHNAAGSFGVVFSGHYEFLDAR
jgi:hypothetical protein